MDDLLNHAQQLANQSPTPIIQPIQGRVAYLVNQGRGTANDSTQQLAEALNQQGLEALCMVRPGWPWDVEGEGNDLITPESDINGVRYLHSALPSSVLGCASATLEATVEKLIKLLRVYRPAVVLAETAGVGLAAWIVAKRLGLAFYGVIESVSGGDGAESSTGHYSVDSEAGAATTFVEEKALNVYPQDRAQEIYTALTTHRHMGSLVPTAADKECHQSYNVLTLLDESSQYYFKHTFNLIPTDAESWEQQLDRQDIDIFFVSSVLPESNSIWHYSKPDLNGVLGGPFKELLLACKQRRIPTVFWNKDDPLSYDMFIDTARLFDYVFTVDEPSIARYKKDVAHGRVYLLAFAAQETLHFPQVEGAKNGRVAFSDRWVSDGNRVRTDQLEMLFDYPLKKGVLDIYGGGSLPDKYKKSVCSFLSGSDIKEEICKKYSVMINANATGFPGPLLAREFYELCGRAVPIVSPPINNLPHELGNVVQIVNNKKDAQEKISRLLEDDIYALKVAAQGVRLVHSSNTYRHRFSQLLSKVVDGSAVDSKYVLNDEGLNVTAVCVSKRPWLIPRVAKMLKAQNGVNVNVIYVAHDESVDEKKIADAFRGVKSCRFMRLTGEDKVLADGLNLALDNCETDVVAKIDDDDYYGPNYLLDACLALQYSGAALVGKTSFFCYVESTNDFALRFANKHYRYFKHVQGGTLMWSRKKTGNLKFNRVKQGTDSLFLKDLLAKGCEIYSSDPFNFIHVRYAGAHDHTWAIKDGQFLEAAKKLDKGLQFYLAFN
ncbi:hypothetical protein [Vreelandella alkaliphila]|uniref:hypothetical protein n=1 Tax=Vreelandella alkaliphila TaxID=272774 RepID=UPI003FD72756